MSIDNLAKLSFGEPLQVVEEHNISNGEGFCANYDTHVSQGHLKRRRIEEFDENRIYTPGQVYTDNRANYTPARMFMAIKHNPFVYHTEDWKPRGCAMYLPLTEDIMINTRNIEQISFENDQFFLADEKGNYVGAKSGNAIHLWRFDPNSRKLYISRSILFLKELDYQHVQYQLESL